MCALAFVSFGGGLILGMITLDIWKDIQKLMKMERNYIPLFKPGVFYWEGIGITELLLKDTATVWCQHPRLPPNTVEMGYDMEGGLVGVKIWDDVRKRNKS